MASAGRADKTFSGKSNGPAAVAGRLLMAGPSKLGPPVRPRPATTKWKHEGARRNVTRRHVSTRATLTVSPNGKTRPRTAQHVASNYLPSPSELYYVPHWRLASHAANVLLWFVDLCAPPGGADIAVSRMRSSCLLLRSLHLTDVAIGAIARSDATAAVRAMKRSPAGTASRCHGVRPTVPAYPSNRDFRPCGRVRRVEPSAVIRGR